jgi:phenylalanyl-tRNA synthetase beta chain
MRVPLEWLAEFLTLDAPLDAVIDGLQRLGLPVERVERLEDGTVLEIELTTNRPDCMCMLGVAREAALLFDRPVHGPAVPEEPRAVRRSEELAVEILDPERCPRFTAQVLDDVRVGPSPSWAQRRLEAAGVRPVNNVVDVTNYVMFELGQPMHAFDHDRLAGARLVVRPAREGERLRTLDGVDRVLEAGTLVVADAVRAVALAGIIGGSETEIGPGTTRVTLEAAYWKPAAIGQTARRLGTRTEASARFERGMDPEALLPAQRRAAQLLREWCGGRARGGIVDLDRRRRAVRRIRLRPKRVQTVLGVDVPPAEIARMLRALGCLVAGAAVFQVQPPSFRPDLRGEEDLIEEVARIFGYDRVPATLPRGETPPADLAPALAIDARIRDTLVRAGLTEVMTLTLVPPEVAARDGAPVMIQNPLVVDQSALRTSLLPGLMAVLAGNAARRFDDVQVFELGRVFNAGPRTNGGSARPAERRTLGVALMGRWRAGWNVPPEQAGTDFYRLKGILETLLWELGITGWSVMPDPAPGPRWHPGRTGVLHHAGRDVGRLGELHPDWAAAERLSQPAYLAEVDVEGLLSAVAILRTAPEAPRYPAVERDLAAIAPDALPAAEVEAAIRAAGGPLLEALALFDVYAGPPLPPGHRNLAYRLHLRAPDRTLTADEAEEILGKVRIALLTRGVRLRE